MAAAVVVSLLTDKPIQSRLAGLTFGTLSEEQKADNQASYTWVDIVASLFVVSIVIFIMIYFS